MRKLGSLLLLLAITAVGAASAAAPEPSHCARRRRRATRDPSLSCIRWAHPRGLRPWLGGTSEGVPGFGAVRLLS